MSKNEIAKKIASHVDSVGGSYEFADRIVWAHRLLANVDGKFRGVQFSSTDIVEKSSSRGSGTQTMLIYLEQIKGDDIVIEVKNVVWRNVQRPSGRMGESRQIV